MIKSMIYFTAHTFNCVSHCIRLMFRVLGMYNFGVVLGCEIYSWLTISIFFDLKQPLQPQIKQKKIKIQGVFAKLTREYRVKNSFHHEKLYLWQLIYWQCMGKQKNGLNFSPNKIFPEYTYLHCRTRPKTKTCI